MQEGKSSRSYGPETALKKGFSEGLERAGRCPGQGSRGRCGGCGGDSLRLWERGGEKAEVVVDGVTSTEG